MVPKDAYILIPRPDYITLHGKGDLADVIKLRIWIIVVAQCSPKDLCKRDLEYWSHRRCDDRAKVRVSDMQMLFCQL